MSPLSSALSYIYIATILHDISSGYRLIEAMLFWDLKIT